MIEVVKIGAPFLGKIVDFLVDPIKRQFTYMCCFNSNITELETQLKDLETTRQGVQMGVDENRRKVRVIGPNVEAWLTSADEVTTEVEGIIQDKDKVKEGCLNGWCPNLKLRYSLSRKAVKKTKVVVDLKADGVRYTQSSYSPPPACLETITNRDFMEFESRRIIMEEIMKALKHDEINLIGVCGMAGVGKTKMVQEVRKRAKEEKLFDEVAFVAVGQNLEITKVQNSIADNFGLKDLKTQDDATTRASLLRRRLSQDNKKILLILDDIWAEFNLEDHGIPVGGSHETFKIIYTSRFRGIWHDVPNKKEIPLVLLLEDEAWQLFKEKAGDSAEAPDLQPISKQIVDKCGCLPLALVLIGSALSKKSGRNDMKEIWKGTLDRLNCAGSTPADKDLSSRLALSYEYLEDEQAKRLFLLCCLFGEDEDIRIEDLARYGLGLSLFDGILEMEKVRHQVFLIVDDLKSRYLLLDGKNVVEECVKVHDVVRDMGISIASKNKSALVIHGEVSEWPKKDTYEHYTSMSVISRKIIELPKGLALAFPNLEFLLLDCRELKELPCQFFEGMGKLKVLLLNHFNGILSLSSSLKNLHTLSLPFFNGKLDNVSEFGGLFNLKTLCFRNSRWMEELPEEIGELVNLRSLDLTGYGLQKRIPPNVISRLVNLEELYVGGVVDLRKGRKVDFKKLYGRGKFKDWEGEGKEEGRNANLRELKFLSNLNTLEIFIRSDVLIPKVRIFSKLKIYKVIIVQDVDIIYAKQGFISEKDVWDKELEDEIYNLFSKCKRVFMVGSSTPVPSNRGGIDSLLRRSDCLYLKGKGCNDLVQALLLWDGVDGLQQLKLLRIERCDTPECLANTMNPVHLPIAHVPAIFPILEVLYLLGLVNLREICGGPIPAHSFGELTFIQVQNCGRLRSLFQLPIVGCLPQLKRLIISSCGMMEEFFWKDQQEDVHYATNRIEFPKLEVLKLKKLPSLMRFCRGIDQIDFPQLKELCLEDCGRLRNLFQLTIVGCLPQLKRLIIISCGMMKEVFWKDQQEDVHAAANRIEFPKLEVLKLEKLPRLMHFCRGIDQIDFPQLKELCLEDIPHVNLLFHNSCNLSFNSKRNDNFGFLSLFPEKVSLPNLKVLRVDQLENLERLEHCPLSVGSFSKLNKIFLRDCGKLLCVIPSQFLPMLRELEELTVERCNSLEVVFELEGLESNEPNLKVLHLFWLVNLREICGGPVPACSFGELTFIQVQNCGRLRNLFQLPIVGCLSQLKRLIIWSCGMMEEVFCKDQQEDVHAATNRIEFPKLEVLNLKWLPSLMRFCKGIDQIDFPQLQELCLRDCGGLRNLFQLPIVGCLPQLKRLIISSCGMMEEVFWKEQQEDVHAAANRIEFPKLEFLKLEELPSLMRFCRGIDQIDFPQLKELCLRDIPQVNLLFHNNGNLSSNSKRTISLFPEKVSLPNLEVLRVDKLENLERLGHGPLPVGSLSKLKEFTVKFSNKLLCVIPSQFLPMLRELQELTVESCNSLEVVFELEGLESNEPNPEILYPLKFVKLRYLPKLNCISKRDPLGIKYIQTLEIHNCNSLRYVFAPTMMKSIPELCKLEISSCEILSRIVAEENGLGESSVDEVEFPQLERLELLDLPNLLSFFPNVNVNGNTTTLAKSTGHYHNPLQPRPLFNDKVAFTGLEYLELSGLETVSDLWCSELPTSSFSKLKTLYVRGFMNLRSTFHPSIVGGLANLSELVITDCSKMEGVVYWEEEIEDGQGRKVEKILFPLLRKLKLSNLPNLVSFFPIVNTTTLAKSNDHLYNPMQPQPLFNEKVVFPCIKYLGLSGLRNVSELTTSSFSKLKNLQVTDSTSLRNFPCIVWIDDLNNTTQGLQEVAQLLYTNYGDGVLALGSNGTMTMWKRDRSQHNPIGKVATSVLPQWWEPSPRYSAMTNDVTGVNLEEAVPCVALSNEGLFSIIISACGGKVSLYDPIQRMRSVERTFMPPPPASTFLAFHPRDDDIIAIGMEDSTIRIYNHKEDEVKSELKGHEKRITGLAFSTKLNILVSSGADAQLCIWRIDTWEHFKSVSIPLPADKACNGDTRVQFHSDQIRLLVSHETQLAIYDASEMYRIRQWVPQDILPAPISFAVYSCNSQLVYTSFRDGNIGVFDADSLTLACHIVPSIYLYPAML